MNIYWDRQNRMFISSLTNSAQLSLITAKLRDQLPIDLYILEPDSSTGAYVQKEAPAGYAPKLGIRSTRIDSDPVDPVVFCGTWVLSGSEAAGTAKYVGLVNLAETALITEMGVVDYADMKLEITLRDVSGNKRDSTDCDIRILYDIMRGGEKETTWVPPFPWVEEFTDAASGKKCLRFKNSDGETVGPIASPTGV